ncbi:hypothetical protein VE03_10898 [Pseudogymnoascus sp. 23342-1-I1]|nr:hypothetical protein VE03_10898 [Pseudogymnoascus sp. 23342-1-I1]
MDDLPGSSGKSKKHRGNKPSTSSTLTECPSAAFTRDKDGVVGEINRITQSQGPTNEGNHPLEDTDGLIPLLDHIIQGSSSHGNNSNTYGTSVVIEADAGLRELARVAELDSMTDYLSVRNWCDPLDSPLTANVIAYYDSLGNHPNADVMGYYNPLDSPLTTNVIAYYDSLSNLNADVMSYYDSVHNPLNADVIGYYDPVDNHPNANAESATTLLGL